MASPATTTTTIPNLETKQILIITFSCLFIFVTVLGAGLRVYGRWALVKKLFVEDVFMLFSALAALGLSAVCITGACFGVGKHDTNISTSDLDVLHQTSLIAVYLWIGAALLIKLSFLLFYHRLDPRKPMRYAVYALLALVLAQNLALIFVAAFSCMASSDGLDDRNCWKASSMQWYVNANGIVIAVLDLGILVTPMFMLHRLAIPKDKKYAVGAQFGLAALPIIAGCLRCYYTWQLVSFSDPFYHLANPAICAQAEVHLAILCGSASSFNLLLKGCEWLPCHRPSTSTGSLPSMNGHWVENKAEQITWQNWRLSQSQLSGEIIPALHRNFGSKEAVINANSPRGCPRIVVDKRRYTNIAGMPSRIRSLGVETNASPSTSYLPQRNTRAMSTPAKRLPPYQQEDVGDISETLMEDASERSVQFVIDKGHESQSAVSVQAIVRFPSIASRLEREKTCARAGEREMSQKRSSVRLVSGGKDDESFTTISTV